MNIIEYVESLPMAKALGWTLLHFLWQGAVLATLLWGVLFIMRHFSANARYIVCCLGMALMMMMPFITLKVVLNTMAKGLTPFDPSLLALGQISPSFWDRIMPILPWLALAWLAGTLLFQGRLILNWLQAQRMKSHGTTPAPVEWQRTVRKLCRRLQMTKKVFLFVSSRAQVPMVMGWIRPVILIPSYALTGLTPHQLQMVIAHELAHVRRHDYIVNLIQSLFESLLFFHPAVWWLSDRLRVEREYCCDDAAVRLYRDPLRYAKALSSLDVLRDDAYQVVCATTGGSLMNRIFRLVGVRSKPSPRLGGWLAPMVIATTMIAAVAVMSLAPVSGSDMEDPKPAVKVSPKKVSPEKIVTIEEVPAKEELAMLKKKEEMLITKMKAEGKSKEEITKAVQVLYKDFEKSKKAPAMKKIKAPKMDPEVMAKKMKKLEIRVEKLVEKMKKAGKSEDDIYNAVGQLYMMHGIDPKAPEEVAFKKKAKGLVEKMKAEGKSQKEIDMALKAFEKDYELSMKASDEKKMLEKKAQTIAKQMEADGKSKEEIDLAIKSLYKEHQAYTKMSKGEKIFKQKADELVKKMKADGKSDNEIKKAIVELEKKSKKGAEGF